MDIKAVEQTVLHTVREYDMLSPGDAVLVGLSGGADSVCLLTALDRLKERLGITLHAAHVNHLLRGAESERDEQFVRELCTAREIPLHVQRVDVETLAKRDKRGVEETGRRVRYAFFRELCAAHHLQKFATAHNADDNAETILMYFLRGTGVSGLRGIAYRDGPLIRPLLDVPRTEIERYLGDTPYVTDSTNADVVYRRNCIRHILLPSIKKNVNPNIAGTLCTHARYYKEIDEMLGVQINSAYAEVYVGENGSLLLDTGKAMAWPPAIRRGVVARMLEAQGAPAELRHTQAVLNLLAQGETGKKVDIGNGVCAAILYGTLEMGKTVSVPDFCTALQPGGEAELPQLGVRICTRIVDAGQPRVAGREVIDYDCVKSQTLTVRSRRAGDWLCPLGLPHKKKLKDFYIDQKIPRRRRERIPLVTDGANIVWVCGLRLDERYKVTDATRRVLELWTECLGDKKEGPK